MTDQGAKPLAKAIPALKIRPGAQSPPATPISKWGGITIKLPPMPVTKGLVLPGAVPIVGGTGYWKTWLKK